MDLKFSKLKIIILYVYTHAHNFSGRGGQVGLHRVYINISGRG